ncbi:MAG TPA: LacI family DNA-binding transcriptional regulator [Jiangellaceae bacterium]|nr:LacI family DNA-binding transcriptional regulator [Jiangellaceae bacterium]
MAGDHDNRRRHSGAVTIYDVAREVGVAPSTVSRAFSRPGRVNAETAERIRRVADELGYRANPMARALTTARTSMVAMVTADITNPVFFEIIRGADEAASQAGYVMLLADTQESDRRERDSLDRVVSNVDGIVLTSSRMSDSAIRMIAKQKPTIVLNRAVTDVPSVVTDDARGVRRAAEHLGGYGHRAITYIAGPEASWADGMRWRGLREAALELELTVRRVGPGVPTVDGGDAAAQRWSEHPTSGVIAYNAQMAIGFIRGARALGAQVPDEVSVIGFDNIFGAELVTPPLTTVAAPLRALGSTAVRTLLGLIGGKRMTTRRPLVVPTRLVVRGSTARHQA